MRLTVPERRPEQHLVSRGYQRNFAGEEHRVVLFEASSGRVLDQRKPVRSNWRRAGFNDVEVTPGVHDDSLEVEFSRIETRVLDQIRRIDCQNCGPEMRHAAAELFAMHLVRSDSFRSVHDGIVDQLRADEISRIAANESVQERFVQQYGRPPAAGEIEGIANRGMDWLVDTGRNLVSSMVRQYNQLGERLNSLFMQVLWTRHPVPGFILSDVPVVHADLATQRFGFRDGVALGDANLIVGPLTRRAAVCFAARRLPHAELRTRREVDLVNAIFWRAARNEVLCHPADSHPASQLFRRLDRLPTTSLKLG